MAYTETHHYHTLIWAIMFILWKAVDHLTGKKEKEPEGEEMRLVPDLTSQTKYYVNGKKVSVGLTYYYMGLLKLFGEKEITDDTIRRAYVHRYNEKREKKDKSIDVIDDQDIRAAKLYMLDRWKYLAFSN